MRPRVVVAKHRRSPRPYGTVANAGVHGKPVELPLEKMWISNVRINMGLVDCRTVGSLLNMVRSGRRNTRAMATHRFTMSPMEEAYELFGNPAQHPGSEGGHHGRLTATASSARCATVAPPRTPWTPPGCAPARPCGPCPLQSDYTDLIDESWLWAALIVTVTE